MRMINNLIAGIIISAVAYLPSTVFGLIYYKAIPFEKFSGSSSELAGRKTISSIDLTAFKNENEPCSFIMATNKKMNLRIENSELVNSQGYKIALDNIDIRIVKVWEQMLNFAYQPGKIKKIITPELLLTNEQDILRDRWEDNRYFAPEVSLKRMVMLTENKPKQIWVTIKIPKASRLGTYTGHIYFYDDDTGKLIDKLKIAVDVLPYELPSITDKIIGIFYQTHLEPDHEKYEPPEIMEKELNDIREHGFNLLVASFETSGALNQFLDLLDKIKFHPILILRIPFNRFSKDVRKRLDRDGRDYFIYGVDEPDREPLFSQHIELSKKIRASGLRVMTSLQVKTAKKLKELEPLDIANLLLQDALDRFVLERKKGETKRLSPHETYYWQCYIEDFIRNRLYAGIYLWKIGLDGIIPFTYMAFAAGKEPENLGRPYESDERKVGNKPKIYKMSNTVYPTAFGPMPTLQWESLREGIDDYRLLLLMRQLFVSESEISELLRQFTFIGNPGLELDTKGISASSFVEFREKAIKIIKKNVVNK